MVKSTEMVSKEDKLNIFQYNQSGIGKKIGRA